MAMYRCPYCGLQYEEDDLYLFCPGCGQRVNVVVRAVTQGFRPLMDTHANEVKCPFCMTMNPAGSTKCRACDSQIDIEKKGF